MKIYQIWYNELSKTGLNPAFIPYDNREPERPHEFEYGVMRKLYHDPATWEKNKYLGVMSWKFQSKTGLHPTRAVEWLKKNKGADVYTFNPFTNMKQFNNVWFQGEYFHPGMLEFVNKLFTNAGLDTNMLIANHSPNVLCYCNYWVANKKFWDKYMEYTETLYKYICDCQDQEIINKLYHIKADAQIDSAMFSFIFERMFSTVLRWHQSEFKVRPYFT